MGTQSRLKPAKIRPAMVSGGLGWVLVSARFNGLRSPSVGIHPHVLAHIEHRMHNVQCKGNSALGARRLGVLPIHRVEVCDRPFRHPLRLTGGLCVGQQEIDFFGGVDVVPRRDETEAQARVTNALDGLCEDR